MFGWLSAASTLASRSKRASRSWSPANSAGIALIATSRPSLLSRARQTSPIPPFPSGPVTAYGPRFEPTVSVMVRRKISQNRRAGPEIIWPRATFHVLHDLRYAIRRLRNSPGFSTVAIATIAVAVGANTAMFSLVNGLLLRPLPYPEPNRIVRVLERRADGGINGISTLNYLDWANQSSAFEYLAAEAGWAPTLTGTGEAVVIRAARVSAHYFDIFGVKPARGRTFRPGDERPGNDRVVLISHVLWETRFGSDSTMVGRDIRLNGEDHTVIGILPQGGPFDR